MSSQLPGLPNVVVRKVFMTEFDKNIFIEEEEHETLSAIAEKSANISK